MHPMKTISRFVSQKRTTRIICICASNDTVELYLSSNDKEVLWKMLTKGIITI